MLLAVNVGNENISFAIFDESGSEPAAQFSIAADLRKTADEYAVTVKQLLDFSGIDGKAVDGAIMASVVPGLNDVMRHVILTLTGKTPISVGPGVKTGFAIKIDDPAELGADIVANSAEVAARLKAEGRDRSAIILGLGSVTTLFAINKNREVIGGAILPGVGMSLDVLHKETAQLPNVSMSGSARAIGKNTKESLMSGVFFGQAAMIDGLVDRFEHEMKAKSGEVALFATGEHCEIILGNLRHSFEYDPALTLKGLARIYKNTVG